MLRCQPRRLGRAAAAYELSNNDANGTPRQWTDLAKSWGTAMYCLDLFAQNFAVLRLFPHSSTKGRSGCTSKSALAVGSRLAILASALQQVLGGQAERWSLADRPRHAPDNDLDHEVLGLS